MSNAVTDEASRPTSWVAITLFPVPWPLRGTDAAAVWAGLGPLSYSFVYSKKIACSSSD